MSGWTKFRLGAGAVVIVFIAAMAWWDRQHATVHFVNGLDDPMVATITPTKSGAPQTVELTKNRAMSLQLDNGDYRIRTTLKASGALVEEEALTVSGGEKCLFYNALGAAPVYLEKTIYSTSKANTEEEGNPELLAGPRLYTNRSVSWVFREPPSSVRLGRGEQRRVTWGVSIPEGQSWGTSVAILVLNGKTKEAAELVARVAAVPFPSDTTAESAVTAYFMNDGPREVLFAALQQNANAHPTSASARYWELMLAPYEGRRASIEDAAAKFPNDPGITVLLFVTYAERGAPPEQLAPLRDKLKTMALSNAQQRRIARVTDPTFTLPKTDADRTLVKLIRKGRKATVEALAQGELELDYETSGFARALAYPLAATLVTDLGGEDGSDAAEDIMPDDLYDLSQKSINEMVLEGKPNPDLFHVANDLLPGLRLALAIHAKDKAQQRGLLDAALRDEKNAEGPIHLLVKSWF